MKLARVFLN